jgi:peptidoglycan/LPS O-acetylase OafA/YrhL
LERNVISYEQFRSVRVFGCLDGLRCLSIVAVVWHHTASGVFERFWPATRLGFLGVDLFFEISGFLIVTILLRERDATGSISLRRFYARRALRIFPLYYGLLGVCALLYFVVRPHTPNAVAFRNDLPFLLTYLTNWFHASGLLGITWSLSAEEQFYLLWPAVEKWLARFSMYVLLGVIAVSQIIHFHLLDPQLQRWFGWSPDEPGMLRETTFTPICLGVLLAHLLHDPRAYARIARWLGARICAPFWLMVLILLCNVLRGDLRGWGRLSVHITVFFLLASCVVREDNGLAKILMWRPVARVGILSYGIYLLHPFAMDFARRGLNLVKSDSAVVYFLATLAVAVGLAELSYRFYETPFLRMKIKFSAGASTLP